MGDTTSEQQLAPVMRSSLLEPMYVSIKAAAAFLGVPHEQMYRLAHGSILDARYLGSRRLVSLAGLREYADRPRNVGDGMREKKVEPMYLSIPDAADFLAVSTSTIRELLDEQIVRSMYLGTRRLVSLESLRKFGESLPIDPPESLVPWRYR